MPKKCSICGEKAEFRIKDVNEFYCENCASANFADVSLLVKVQHEAERLRKYLEEEQEINKKL